MTQLLQHISNIVPSMEGWCTVKKAEFLASCVYTLRPKTVVEIGVWGGRSLIPMAMACKDVGGGIVWGIDPWQNSASTTDQVGDHLKWWGSINHDVAYQSFLKHIREQRVGEFVKVVRKKSDEVQPPDSVDILHTDGNHGSSAIRDVERFAPSIRIGGLCILDDLGWPGGAVTAAAKKLVDIGFVEILRVYNKPTADDDWAVYQRVKP